MYTATARRRRGVKALAHGGCWCALCPCFRLARLRVNSPSTLLAAAFPCRLWTLVPKITRRVLPLVGYSLPWLLGRLAYFLEQTSHLSSLSYFLWPPFPASLWPWHLPFYCSCSSESRRVAAHPCGPESPASVLWGILVSHCIPVASAGTVESRGAVCVLCRSRQPSLLGLLTRCLTVCKLNAVAGTPCLLVLPGLSRAVASQL